MSQNQESQESMSFCSPNESFPTMLQARVHLSILERDLTILLSRHRHVGCGPCSESTSFLHHFLKQRQDSGFFLFRPPFCRTKDSTALQDNPQCWVTPAAVVEMVCGRLRSRSGRLPICWVLSLFPIQKSQKTKKGGFDFPADSSRCPWVPYFD